MYLKTNDIGKTKDFVLIGGSKKYGSGKVIKYLGDRIKKRPYFTFQFIETQEKKFDILKDLILIQKNSLIIFQPSIAFPSFLRDCFILLFLRLKRIENLYFLLLVDLKFKNKILKFAIIRRLFFGRNLVFAPAQPSYKICNIHRLTAAFFEISTLTSDIINPLKPKYCFISLGYRNKIKGWEHFAKYTSEVADKIECISIGSFDNSTGNNLFKHIKMLEGSNTLHIQRNLQDLNKTFLPIYVFSSNFDFAPLMILEAGYWGVPICVIEGSEAHHILNRFIPSDCFHIAPDLKNISIPKLISAKTAFSSYINSISELDFSDEIIEKLSQ